MHDRQKRIDWLKAELIKAGTSTTALGAGMSPALWTWLSHVVEVLESLAAEKEVGK